MLSIEDTLLHIRKAKLGDNESKSVLIEKHMSDVKPSRIMKNKWNLEKMTDGALSTVGCTEKANKI